MPEYIVLVSAIACVGAGVVLYFNRGNVPALAVVILGAIALLYGVGQYYDRANVDARALGFADDADRRAAQEAGITDSERWKRRKQPAEAAPAPTPMPATAAKTEDKGAPVSAPSEAERTDPLTGLQQMTAAEPKARVAITNINSRRTGSRYVEVSATVINRNEFAIKNIVLTCGDRSYASGDVSTVVEQVIPPRSDLSVQGLRLGPIRPELPPTTCAIAKYERAN